MIWNAFVLALQEIRRNLMRSFLTVLGIIIGVAAVIIMVTIGNGVTRQVTSQIESLGSNLLMISPGQMRPGASSGTAPLFRQSDVDAIEHEVSSIKAVVPTSSQSVEAIYGNENHSTSVTGTVNQFFTVRDWNITSGRQFTESELRAGVAVCILGKTVAEKLYGNQNPIGKEIRLQKFTCRVIGLLASKGQNSMGSDQDDIVLIPLRIFQRRISGNTDISMIQVSVEQGKSSSKVQNDIERLLRERRHITSNEEDNFNVMDTKEIANTLSGTTRVLTALLGAVAAVSLLVGGIGIMNIMLVSVTERTREIGIRMAIGALEREVLTQFLVEAVVLSSLGGLLGILIAIFSSYGLAHLLNVPFILSLNIICIAFLFSASVGVIFGFFPAQKASRLNPIDALHHE